MTYLKNTTEEGVKKQDFILFLNNLIPYLDENSILIMDNAKIHRSNVVSHFLYENNLNHLYLPPFSPDYNAIELLFSKLKSELKKFHLIDITIPDAINEILELIPRTMCERFCRHVIHLIEDSDYI